METIEIVKGLQEVALIDLTSTWPKKQTIALLQHDDRNFVWKIIQVVEPLLKEARACDQFRRRSCKCKDCKYSFFCGYNIFCRHLYHRADIFNQFLTLRRCGYQKTEYARELLEQLIFRTEEIPAAWLVAVFYHATLTTGETYRWIIKGLCTPRTRDEETQCNLSIEN